MKYFSPLLIIYFAFIGMLQAAPVLRPLLYDNGVFQGPSYRDFAGLSSDQVSKMTQSYQSNAHQSFFTTPEGQDELKAIAMNMLPVMAQTSRVISIGRSGTGIEAFINGIVMGSNPSGTTPIPFIEELPFSCSADHISSYYKIPYTLNLNAAQIQGIRNHLLKNGLSPQEIISLKKPILFFDFVYSGTGATVLLQVIHQWAQELGLSEGIARNIRFFGLFPAYRLVYNAYQNLRHASVHEGRGDHMPPKEYMQKEASGRPISLSSQFDKWVHDIHIFRLSSEMYDYSGNNRFQGASGITYNKNSVQESFTPSFWANAVVSFPEDKNRFQGNEDLFEFQELVSLYEAGKRSSNLICESALSGPSPGQNNTAKH